MKIKRMKTYRAKADVVKIDCYVNNADITFTSTDRPDFVIEYSKNLSLRFAEDDGIVTIRQIKTPLLNIRKPVINFLVPDCCVPSITLRMKNGIVALSDIIFNDVEITGNTIKTDINGCSFENLTIKAKDLNATAEAITVKNLANATADDGNVGIDNSFCKKAECRMKSGNIGVSCSTCEYTVLNTGNGTVAANMVGNEKDYTIELEGASVIGKENVSESGKSFRARSATGSVVVDFSLPEGEAELEENAEKAQDEEIELTH